MKNDKNLHKLVQANPQQLKIYQIPEQYNYLPQQSNKESEDPKKSRTHAQILTTKDETRKTKHQRNKQYYI